MAYVGTLATSQDGAQVRGLRAGGIRRTWSLFLAELARQIGQDRRDLRFDRALGDLDRHQLVDIGICRDAC